jgi:hypothetical protein
MKEEFRSALQKMAQDLSSYAEVLAIIGGVGNVVLAYAR